MKLLKKILSILLTFCLLLGVSVSKPVPTKAITKFRMELSSPRAGANSEYKFYFSIEKTVKVHDWIKLVLPPGTRYMKIPTSGSCLVDMEMPSIGTLPDGSLEFKFNVHIELDPEKEGYKNITITLPAKSLVFDGNQKYYTLEFFNPPIPGSYTYKIATQSEPTLVESKPVNILVYPLSSPIVDIEPDQTNVRAGYSIDLDLNQFCDLKAGQDTINIQFPKEVVFSKSSESIQRDWMTVNESDLLELPSIKDNILIIPIPYDLKSSQHISIKIDSRVGLTNPEKAGMYELKVRFSNQINWFQSFPYFVATQPSPVLLKIEPPYSGDEAEFSILHYQERNELNPLDTIYVRFPEKIRLSPSLQKSEVLINNKPVFQVNIEGQIVAITLRSHAKGWMPLEIKFTKQAGIKLPRAKTAIQLELKLSENAVFLPTNPVEIT